ncbi:MAG: ribosome maturation factor RimM [Clostridia bacterium]|nr:ribosome maturation factor RimM [Clostridia bacterium]
MEIKVGKIVNVVGLKGEVKVYGDYESFDGLDKVYLDEKEYMIENVRCQKDMVILKLETVDDRNAAETLRNKEVFIHELRDLPKDTFYIRDLVGLDAIDETTGKIFGKVKDVLTNTAQHIYQIQMTGGREALVPGVKEFIKEINVEKGYVKIMPIPGLIDMDFVEVNKDED